MAALEALPAADASPVFAPVRRDVHRLDWHPQQLDPGAGATRRCHLGWMPILSTTYTTPNAADARHTKAGITVSANRRIELLMRSCSRKPKLIWHRRWPTPASRSSATCSATSPDV